MMKAKDRISGMTLLIISVLICIGAIRLHMGSLSNPGTGLVPFLLGIVIGILSLVMLSQTFIEKRIPRKDDFSQSEVRSKMKPFLILFVLLAYGLLVSFLGHAVTTFLLFVFLLRMITPHRWSVVIGGALLASVGSYVLFQLALNVQLPQGILGI